MKNEEKERDKFYACVVVKDRFVIQSILHQEKKKKKKKNCREFHWRNEKLVEGNKSRDCDKEVAIFFFFFFNNVFSSFDKLIKQY